MTVSAHGKAPAAVQEELVLMVRCTCLKAHCGHSWLSIKRDGMLPLECPRCKSRSWREPGTRRPGQRRRA